MEVWRIFTYEKSGCGGVGMKETKDLKLLEIRRIKKIINERIGYVIKDKKLLQCAFKRSNDIPRKNIRGNENLEFVGESIISFYLNKIMEDRYGYVLAERKVKFNGDNLPCSKEKLKSISNMMERFLSDENLSNVIDVWELGEYLLEEYSIEKDVEDNITVRKANLLKAIIGAIAIDNMRNQEILESAIIKMLELEKCFEHLDESMEKPKEYTLHNAVDMLEDILKKSNFSMPIYKCNDKVIYESDGMRFVCSCYVEQWDITICAYAKDKELAKKYAAYALLCKRFGLVNMYESNVHGTIYKLKDEILE